MADLSLCAVVSEGPLWLFSALMLKSGVVSPWAWVALPWEVVEPLGPEAQVVGKRSPEPGL